MNLVRDLGMSRLFGPPARLWLAPKGSAVRDTAWALDAMCCTARPNVAAGRFEVRYSCACDGPASGASAAGGLLMCLL